jgi:hypothetical protein
MHGRDKLDRCPAWPWREPARRDEIEASGEERNIENQDDLFSRKEIRGELA